MHCGVSECLDGEVKTREEERGRKRLRRRQSDPLTEQREERAHSTRGAGARASRERQTQGGGWREEQKEG